VSREHAEQQRLARLRAHRLQLRIIGLGRLLGAAFIFAGMMLYIFTAPPLGGLAWEQQHVVVAVALIASGLTLLVTSDRS
jgi:hypothetical protein